MPTFPTLKTGAIAQYPLTLQESFRTEAISFLDGTSHRYSTSGAPRRQWFVRLESLDPRESIIVQNFLRKYGTGIFSFTDPVTGDVIPRCTVADSELNNTITSEMNELTSAVIGELP